MIASLNLFLNSFFNTIIYTFINIRDLSKIKTDHYVKNDLLLIN